MRPLTSFVGNFFAIGSFTLPFAALLALTAPASAQQQPVAPSPFQGLANALSNSYAARPRPPATSTSQPAPQPAPPTTITPPGAPDKGGR